MARKSPAFSFYADSWVLGTLAMSYEDQGVYMRMLCFQWASGPSNANAYANACGEHYREHVNRILSSKFECIGDLWHNARLEEERQKQVARSSKAKTSANKRWNAGNPGSAEQNNTPPPMPTHMPTHCERIAQANAPEMHSVSVSVSNEEENKEPPKVPQRSPVIPASLDCEQFQTAWHRWLAYLEAKDGRLNPVQLSLHIKKCAETLSTHGMSKVVADLEASIEGSSRGQIYDTHRFGAKKPKTETLKRLTSSFAPENNPYSNI